MPGVIQPRFAASTKRRMIPSAVTASALNSAARALSFIAVGALVLAGGFFLQRLSSQMAPRRPRTP